MLKRITLTTLLILVASLTTYLTLDRNYTTEVQSLQYQIGILETRPPQVVIKEVPIEVIKEVPVEVVKEVLVPVVEEVIEQVPVSLTNWESLEELKSFLEVDDTNSTIILTAGATGVVTFSGQCEDFAFQLRGRAEELGKYLDTQILSRTDCLKYSNYLPTGIYSLGLNDGHYINKAIISNEVWYVEPQNDKVWKVYNLD